MERFESPPERVFMVVESHDTTPESVAIVVFVLTRAEFVISREPKRFVTVLIRVESESERLLTVEVRLVRDPERVLIVEFIVDICPERVAILPVAVAMLKFMFASDPERAD